MEYSTGTGKALIADDIKLFKQLQLTYPDGELLIICYRAIISTAAGWVAVHRWRGIFPRCIYCFAVAAWVSGAALLKRA